MKSEVKPAAPAAPAAPSAPKPEVKPAAAPAPKSEVKPAASAPPKSEVKPAATPRSEVAPPRSAAKAEKPAPKPEKPAERKPAAAAAAPAKNMGLLIGIGVVVVALVVALVLVLGKKKPVEEVATGEPAPATASLDVSTEPVGAVVTVEAGGASQTLTSNTTFDNLAEGTARVRVELAGFLARETTLAVTAGAPQSLHMALLPDAAAQVCSLYVAVTPRADKVLINGKPASGKESMFWAVLPAGKYKVEASAAGFTTALAKGSAKASEVKKLALTLASAPADAAASGATTGATTNTAVVPVTEEPADGIALHIEVTPPADITVNHVLRAKAAPSVDVKLGPGKYEVVFEHPDFPKIRKEVQLKAGKTAKPLRVDLSAGEGGISVRGGKAGLKIYVDGRSTGVTTPGVVRGLKPGRRTVELRESNGVTVVASQSVIISDSPQNQQVQF
ncbi:MAG: hypothetical protein HZA61_01730 [Candidatus Eisenbacteria bacterium]|uniref:PEGA domain-containing protein n=1 Tax=Eiseniibacteriota bacterium TaxID=2212470 RepID=A0A933SB38_UNCEI|nr:hypothetical protein [Candidatus Eisenbacteria bacterium]